MKISDLIEVPEIRTVIQLADAESQDRELRNELLETFVLTDEISSHLGLFLSGLSGKDGTGCFLKGHYGSGKTHFLSFLTLVLRDGRLRSSYLPENLRPKELENRRFFVVSVPLYLYPSSMGLDEIVMRSFEKSLQNALGRFESLAETTQLLENFNTYVLPQASDFLTSHNYSEVDWATLCRESPRKASGEALRYLSTLRSNPLQAHYEWKAAFQRLHEISKEEGFDGIVLVIDELSEFLKSKPTPGGFNEDVRFLQFLGEWTSNMPFRVIASLQEGIEEVGYIEENLLRRIKDRYRIRLNLTNRHLESLIEKRVLLKKPGSREIIGKIYRKAVTAFPNLGVKEDYFYKIYPVHPATLTMLENLMGLFSQHRGVVDFLHTRVKGSPGNNIHGILDEPPERLLTCDAIFDHFQEKIREIAELAPYYNVAYQFLAGDIGRLFEDEKDRALTLRLVKIMILSELSPLEHRKSARMLADLTLERVSSIDSNINYENVRENILERLVNESGYVKREASGNDPLETIYFIDLATNLNQLINARTKEVLRKLEGDGRTWMSLLSQMNMNNLPLAGFTGGAATPAFIKWENTEREGWIRLGDITRLGLGELQNLESSLRVKEKDFMFLIGVPSHAEAQTACAEKLLLHLKESPFAPAIIFWIPREADEKETKTLLTTYAHMKLLEEVSGKAEEKEAEKYLAETLEKEIALTREILTASYFQGKFFGTMGKLPLNFSECVFLPFQAFLHRLFSEGLEKIYPLHKHVKPRGGQYLQHQLEQAAAVFFESGKITVKDAEKQGIDGALESAFVALGIAKRLSGSFHMVVEPQKNGILTELLKLLIPGRSVALDDIYLKLRKGSYGLIRPFFNLVTAALLHSGFLTAYRQGHLVASPSLRKLYDYSIDSVGEGKILEREYQALLPACSFLWGEEIPLVPFTMQVQKTLWEACTRSLGSIRKELRDFALLLEKYRGYQVFSYLSHDELSALAESLMELPDLVHEGLEARKGLEKIAIFFREHSDYRDRHLQFQSFGAFFAGQMEAFQRMRGMLTNPAFFIPSLEEYEALSLKKQLFTTRLQSLRDVILEGKWEELYGSFQAFFQEYMEAYETGHQAFYEHRWLTEWRSLQDSIDYGVLLRLSRIFSIQVENDIIKIRRILEELPSTCSRQVREELLLSGACKCGYSLGQQLAGIPPGDILEIVRKGINEILSALGEAGSRETLESYMDGLKTLGKTDLVMDMRHILESAGKPAANIAPHISDEVIYSINRALSGSVLILERDIDSLYERLMGRKFPPGKLRELIEKWLQGGPGEKIGEDTLIHIVSGAHRDDFSLWDGYLPVRKLIREEGSDFLEGFWVAYYLGVNGSARDSIFLSSRHKVDLSRLDEIIAVGKDALQTHRRFDDVALVEEKLTQSPEYDLLVEEFALERKPLEELVASLGRDTCFSFISRRAALMLIDRCGEDGSLIEGIVSSLGRIEGWPNINEILESGLKIIGAFTGLQSGEDILSQYTEHISPLSYHMERLKTLQLQGELLAERKVRDLEKRAREVIKEYTGVFTSFAAEGKMRTVKDFLPEIYVPAKKCAPSKFLLIFDGLRWDIWSRLRPQLTGAFPSHRAEVIPLLSLLPTDTPTNRPWLTGVPLEEYEGQLEGESLSIIVAGDTPGKRAKMEEFFNDDPAAAKAIHFNFIDDRIHKSTTPLYVLYEELAKELESLVIPWLRRIAPGALVFILSDHGFTYDPRKKAPYSHGGGSPFEMIVPCAVLKPGNCP